MGASLRNIAETVGGMGLLAGSVVKRLFTLKLDGAEVVRNLYRMGVKSIPIVVVHRPLHRGHHGAPGLSPWCSASAPMPCSAGAAGFGTLREIAPLLTALMINGRVGANNTAELGTMVADHRADRRPPRPRHRLPISFLIAPRVVAMVKVTLFLATIFADTLALVGAKALSGQALLGVAPRVFYNGLTGGLLGIGDVTGGLVKSVVFGVVMALASCQYGLRVTGGAPGVGRAVNATVVASAAGIFVLDYLVSFTL